eukprot:284819371_6
MLPSADHVSDTHHGIPPPLGVLFWLTAGFFDRGSWSSTSTFLSSSRLQILIALSVAAHSQWHGEKHRELMVEAGSENRCLSRRRTSYACKGVRGRRRITSDLKARFKHPRLNFPCSRKNWLLIKRSTSVSKTNVEVLRTQKTASPKSLDGHQQRPLIRQTANLCPQDPSRHICGLVAPQIQAIPLTQLLRTYVDGPRHLTVKLRNHDSRSSKEARAEQSPSRSKGHLSNLTRRETIKWLTRALSRPGKSWPAPSRTIQGSSGDSTRVSLTRIQPQFLRTRCRRTHICRIKRGDELLVSLVETKMDKCGKTILYFGWACIAHNSIEDEKQMRQFTQVSPDSCLHLHFHLLQMQLKKTKLTSDASGDGLYRTMQRSPTSSSRWLRRYQPVCIDRVTCSRVQSLGFASAGGG